MSEATDVGREVAALREALEQIELLASNHGGWLESDPLKLLADISKMASQALGLPGLGQDSPHDHQGEDE